MDQTARTSRPLTPGHLELERQFTASQATNLTDPQYRAFMDGHFTAKTSMFLGKEMTLFDIFIGEPRHLNTFTLLDAWCNIDEGASIELGDGEQKWEVGHEPVELAAGVFVWMPRFTMIERYLHDGIYRSRISMSIRTTHNPRVRLVEGTNYLVNKKDFSDILKG